MRTEYDTIYLGSSCFALGCAARSAADSLILEATEGLGGEFVDALYAGRSGMERPQGEGAAFFDELVQRGIMSVESAARGEAHIPAVNLVLNRLVLEKGINLLFHMRVLAIRQEGASRLVDAICNAKLYTFRCKQVIDTRSDYADVRQKDPSATCALRANMYAPPEPALGNGWGNITLHKGFLPGEVFLSMPVEKASHAYMLEAVMRAFEARPDAYMALRMLTVAHAYAVTCRPLREQTASGWYIPGCGFDNPVQALAAGLTEQEVF